MSLSDIIDDRVDKLILIIFAVVALMIIGIIPYWLGDFIISFSAKSLLSPIGIIFELFGISLFAIIIYVLKNSLD